ncbi:putative dihydroxy-2-naphthoate octaprenyltransferase [Paratrimastix pyriformis]|uniref:Dihydroxy-2-naphthoate octaprenyltransferase n=1 Tax=Paratrimastix pyriformis TaxID=342808 RepID=A0ABQ8V251_9EUKA|nr:putative dihydroxy-2-naphthoate octaprenyltransferase [Paratrimastix pyriformis]
MPVTFRSLVLATRPWSWSMTIGNAVLASLGAWKLSHSFDFLNALLAIFVVLFGHSAVNLTNSYWDFISGTDKVKKDGGDKTIAGGILTPKIVRIEYQVCYLLSGLLSLVLVYRVQAWGIAAIFVAMGVLGYMYTAPPVSFKSIALGELIVFFLVGPLLTLTTYFFQTGEISPFVVLYAGIPVGFFSAGVLFCNNVRDRDADRSARIYTLAHALTAPYDRAFLLLCLVLPYLYQAWLACRFFISGATSALTIPALFLPFVVLFAFHWPIYRDFLQGKFGGLEERLAQSCVPYLLLLLPGILLSPSETLF